MDTDHFLKILEDMPLGTSSKLRIGENEYAQEMLKKDNPDISMDDIKKHNIECDGWDEGYKEAIKNMKEWRNEQYLKIKQLN